MSSVNSEVKSKHRQTAVKYILRFVACKICRLIFARRVTIVVTGIDVFLLGGETMRLFAYLFDLAFWVILGVILFPFTAGIGTLFCAVFCLFDISALNGRYRHKDTLKELRRLR